MATESYTDLLIIGAGPAGLMAAAWATKYPVSVRIIDDKPTRVQTGHADGLVPRTLEIFDSFGLADTVWKESCHDFELRYWTPDENGRIRRTQTVVSQSPGTSRYHQVLLNQGRLEELFLDLLSSKPGPKIEVERNVITEELSLDTSNLDYGDDKAYPISVRVHHAKENRTEVIRAKYMIGCDGARSWTRRQLGLKLKGDRQDQVWGVLDIVPLTDFPDIRQKFTIHSAKHGNIMCIPREHKMVRIYVQLSGLHKQGEGRDQPDRSRASAEMLFEAAQKVMEPYTLAYRHLDWWSVYQIGQSVAEKFSVADRIFLAGDAIHTHSPKGGQGMNISFQDTYNLCWKLCSVITGLAQPSILRTYESERRQVALDLLAADRDLTRFHASSAKEGLDLQSVRSKLYAFMSGVAVDYAPSLLVARAENSKQHLAPRIPVGRRLPSYKVLNQADACPTHLGTLLRSDGKWRLIVFAGDLANPSQLSRVQRLGEALSAPDSILRRYPFPAQPDCPGRSKKTRESIIEVLTVHSAPRLSVELLDLHEVFHPWDEEMGWDYWKVFADNMPVLEDVDSGQGGNAYEKYGVDRTEGCLVLCRPDQHVSYIGSLEDLQEIAEFFEGFMISCR